MNEIFSNQADKQKINNQFIQIESMRDFIVWICEEECGRPVSEMQEEFDKYLKLLELNNHE